MKLLNHGFEMTKSNKNCEWQNDWVSFTSSLESELQNGATNKALSSRFGGSIICWTGTIEHMNISKLVAAVDVSLAKRIIRMIDGDEIVLDGVSLTIAENETEKWTQFRTGDLVTFKATLGDPDSPFPPIEVKTLRSGKSLIIIAAINAVPL